MRAHTSDEPYILTVPQDEHLKFHHYSRHQADLWLQNTPFSPDEHRNIQYQTFFYHEPHSDVFQIHRLSHFLDRLRPDLPAKTSASGSNANTPSLGPKKKISLAAYKNKQANGSAVAPAEKHTSDGPRQPDLSEDVIKAKPRQQPEPSKSSRENDLSTRKATAQNKLKRKLDTTAPTSAPQSPPVPPKKVRPTMPEAPNTTKARSPIRQRHCPSTDKVAKLPELPARLSPLHLPTKLSPTLPAKILASLESRNHYHHRSTSGSSAISEKPLRPTAPHLNSKHDSVFSDADKQKPTQKSAQFAQNSQSSKPSQSSKGQEGTKAPLPSTEAEQDDFVFERLPSRIVKLKIPKHHRSNVRRLLAMAPARRITYSDGSTGNSAAKSTEKRNGEVKDEVPKGVARKISVAPKVSEKDHVPAVASANKRPRLVHGDASPPASKKRRAPEDIKSEKGPRTPIQPAFESPTLPSSSQKLQLTPAGHRDLRTSVAMKRVESVDGPSNTPPINDHTPSSKPGAIAAQQNNTTTRPSPSAASLRTPESVAWQDEHARLGAVGRELKHSLRAQDKKDSESTAVASIESFLAFILSFYCQERSMATRDPPLAPDSAHSWLTLHGFWNAVRQQCRPYPHLYGVASHLGVFYNGVIFARLSSSGNKARDVDKDLKNLQDAASAVTKAGRSAEDNLPLTAIISDFPQTWKRYLAQGGAANVEDNARPGQYEGKLVLPFSTQSTPLQAVRAAHAMLSEWAAREDPGYKMKLSLTK